MTMAPTIRTAATIHSSVVTAPMPESEIETSSEEPPVDDCANSGGARSASIMGAPTRPPIKSRLDAAQPG